MTIEEVWALAIAANLNTPDEPYGASHDAAIAVLRQHLVPRATGEVGELVERLLRPIPYTAPPGMRVVNPALVNPDGRAAADRITALSAEVERKDEALRDARFWVENADTEFNLLRAQQKMLDQIDEALGAKP